MLTAGFTEMMLTLHGEMRGATFRDGRVGAVLVPDEPRILEAFLERAESALSLEAIATVSANTAWLGSTPTRVAVAFPR